MSAPLSFLADLTLTELEEFQVFADLLSTAGQAARDRGFEPRFALLPGQPVTMRLDCVFLPHRAVAPPEPLEATIARLTDAALVAGDQMMDVALSGAAIENEPDHRIEVAASSVAPMAEAASSPSPQAEPVGLPDVQSVGQAAVVKRSLPQGPGTRAALWTEQEDGVLVEEMARALAEGEKTRKALLRASAAVGRPRPGTEFRYKKLRFQVAARVQAILNPVATAQAVVVAEPEPTSEAQDPAGEPATEEPGGEPGGLQQLIPAEKALVQGVVVTATPEARCELVAPVAPVSVPYEIWLHVQQVPRSDLWTLQTDRDLMQSICTGIPLHMIADEFDMKASAIEGRFDILTNRRNFKREKVLAVLDYMQAEPNAADGAAA